MGWTYVGAVLGLFPSSLVLCVVFWVITSLQHWFVFCSRWHKETDRHLRFISAVEGTDQSSVIKSNCSLTVMRCGLEHIQLLVCILLNNLSSNSLNWGQTWTNITKAGFISRPISLFLFQAKIWGVGVAAAQCKRLHLQTRVRELFLSSPSQH